VPYCRRAASLHERGPGKAHALGHEVEDPARLAELEQHVRNPPARVPFPDQAGPFARAAFNSDLPRK
jgi:hypothetical protein